MSGERVPVAFRRRQAALAGALGERLDAAVVLVAAAVEDGGLDAGGLGALGEQRARRLVACSMRPSERRSASVQVTAASVRPVSSSMSWAKMPAVGADRTEIRGRSAVPRTLARTRRRRRRRRVSLVRTVMRACRPSGRRTRPRSGCPCPCRAPAGAACGCWRRSRRPAAWRCPRDDHARGQRHLELDAVRRLDRHRVRVAERQLEVAAPAAARGSRRPGSRGVFS